MTKNGRVKTSIGIPGSDDRIVLLHWGADDTPRLRNVVRVDRSGRVVWRAELPGQARHDCFVSLSRKDNLLVARTYSGAETRLSEDGVAR